MHLIAKVWQNIKKDNMEKTEQEMDLERERWLIDQLFLSYSWPGNTLPMIHGIQKIANHCKGVSTVLSFTCPGDRRVFEE